MPVSTAIIRTEAPVSVETGKFDSHSSQDLDDIFKHEMSKLYLIPLEQITLIPNNHLFGSTLFLLLK